MPTPSLGLKSNKKKSPKKLFFFFTFKELRNWSERFGAAAAARLCNQEPFLLQLRGKVKLAAWAITKLG